MKSRIVALALISIMLTSTSISAADAYTISFTVSDVNAVSYNQILLPKLVQIDLLDGVTSTHNSGLGNNEEKQSQKLFLFDGIGTLSLNNFDGSNQNTHELSKLNRITVHLQDGVGTDTNDYEHDDVKIIKIKQDHDRKALWERIFPLDRIINNKKTLYKEIQNDHSLSYVQLSEINSEEQETEQFYGYTSGWNT